MILTLSKSHGLTACRLPSHADAGKNILRFGTVRNGSDRFDQVRVFLQRIAADDTMAPLGSAHRNNVTMPVNIDDYRDPRRNLTPSPRALRRNIPGGQKQKAGGGRSLIWLDLV